ncbi:hypothetical protein [Pseudomonas sp. NA-150]|uniref:hypothetical protein n=1 Tax=Pseudomonas sp. NA-150 TaxID=3367525 RepID=UPI0037CBC3C0
MILISFALAFIAGIAIAVQAAVNSQLAGAMSGNTMAAGVLFVPYRNDRAGCDGLPARGAG